MKLLGLFICTMIAIIILDMFWIGGVAKNIYDHNIGMLLRKSAHVMTPIWWAAALVYVCIALGIILFVLPKANGDYMQAFIWGALFGLVTYGIYEFTNYSILAHWPLKITLVDLAWGVVLCGLTSTIAAFLQNKFFT